MDPEVVTMTVDEARELAVNACANCGASQAVSRSLADATVSAEIAGRPEVGFRHLLDYLQGFVDGRIARDATPVVQRLLPTVIQSDARRGIAQLGFDMAYDELVGIARKFGTALFTQKNGYTAGELGHYVRRLAIDGLVAIAAANGPALMAASPGGRPVFCTNPFAFGAPCEGPTPLVIDQASSATAFVNVVRAAETGTPLPEGWALDAAGEPTTDARAALDGALLPFGGYKGANIALMVEILSAGLSGASWSMDAGDFRSGTESPAAGLTVLAISPSVIDPNFEGRLTEQLQRLELAGVHIPGMQSAKAHVCLQGSIAARILSYAAGTTGQ